MRIPDGLKYSKDHEWVRFEGTIAYLGITDFAQDHLGDIVYIELPKDGAEFAAGDVVAAIDSVKAASDIYTPVAGKVTEVNAALEDAPEMLNEDTYEAWIAALEVEDIDEPHGLMDAQQYQAYCEAEEDDA